MKDYLQLALLLVVIVTVIVVMRRARASSNLIAIQTWFVNMDVMAHGQRYRGSRSTVIGNLGHGRNGALGYEVRSLCETKSGRFYILHVQADLSRVSGWSIDPLTPEQAQEIVAREAARVATETETAVEPVEPPSNTPA